MGHDARPPLGDRDATLLRALRERYPEGHFDEHNVAVDAPKSAELLRALDFLDAKVNRRRRALSRRSAEILAGWLDRVEGLPVDGLHLAKDRRGWSRVEAVGCTRAAG
jgi:hypothetical protein